MTTVRENHFCDQNVDTKGLRTPTEACQTLDITKCCFAYVLSSK